MKITDYANIFMIIFLAFFTISNFKDKMNFNYLMKTEEINKLMDNSVVSALENTVHEENGNLSFDLQKISNNFFETLVFFLTGNEYGGESEIRYYLEDNIMAFILIENNGYYLYESGSWSGKTLFSEDSHENKVDEIEKIINERISRLPYRVNFPKNSGEIDSQTISDYSLLVLYKTNEYNYSGKTYADIIIAGAKVKLAPAAV